MFDAEIYCQMLCCFRMFPPTIAVGSDSLNSPSGVYIYEYNDNAR